MDVICAKTITGEQRRQLSEVFVEGFYQWLKYFSKDKQYPFEMKPQMGYVEFVATAPNHRSKGVASAIIEYFFSLPRFNKYVLEVADTNTGAVKLYEKLGFKEFLRTEVKNKKQSSVSYFIYEL